MKIISEHTTEENPKSIEAAEIDKHANTLEALTKCSSKSMMRKKLLIANKFYRSKVPKFSRKRKLQVIVTAKKYPLKCLTRKSDFFLKSFGQQLRLMNFSFPLESRYHPKK